MESRKLTFYLKYYPSVELIYLIYRLVIAKSIFKNARFIRGKIDLRGKSNIKVGKGFSCGRYCRFETNPFDEVSVLQIGNRVELNDAVHITAFRKVCIGNNVLMASRIYISDTSHGSYSGDDNDSHPDIPPNSRPMSYNPVTIDDNVWIGEGVSILPGTHIGKGAIIGANSVVKGIIPAYTIAIGKPARVIKFFNFELNKWESIKQ